MKGLDDGVRQTTEGGRVQAPDKMTATAASTRHRSPETVGVTTFEQFYASERDRLVRLLALDLGDLDLATEATDVAMSRAFPAMPVAEDPPVHQRTRPAPSSPGGRRMTNHSDAHDDGFEAALRDQLATSADALDVPGGDLDAVVRAGRRRRWLTAAAGGVAGLAIVGGAVAAMGTFSGDDLQPSVAGVPTASASPTATATPSQGPTEAPETTPPTASPSPEPDGETTPSTEPATTGPELVIATDDGIVRWQDGETTPVPGIDGPVSRAFGAGDGGVVFQRNDVGIGRLVDGEVSTIVALSQFEPRTFEGYDEPAPATQLRLWDVTSDRIVFTVHHSREFVETPEGLAPPVFDVLYELSLDDGARGELTAGNTWEQTLDFSAGGERTAVNAASEALAGGVSLIDRTGLTPVEALDYLGEGVFAADAPQDVPYRVAGPQLDSRTGGTIATVTYHDPDTPGALLVIAVDGEEELTRTPVSSLPVVADWDRPTVWDHTGDLVVLGDDPRDGSGRPVIVDTATGEATTVDVAGRAALTP